MGEVLETYIDADADSEAATASQPDTVFVYESETLSGDTVQTSVANDEVLQFITQWQQDQQEYQQHVLDTQSFISDQIKNITSLFSVLVLAVGLLSGIVLARAVWRKL